MPNPTLHQLLADKHPLCSCVTYKTFPHVNPLISLHTKSILKMEKLKHIKDQSLGRKSQIQT